MRRRRFLTALAIIASTLTLNVYVDYMLILRNPAELEVMVNEALKAIAPDYAPKLGNVVEFSLSERRVVFEDLAFHEKGKAESPLLQVERVEATLSLVPPALTQIVLIEPEAVVRIDAEGRITPAIQGGDDAAAPSLFSDLNVRIREGRLRIINDFEGMGSESLISNIDVSLDIQTDLSVSGRGYARLGALFDRDDPRGLGGSRPPGTPVDKWFKDVFSVVAFELDGPATEALRAEVRLLRGSFQPALKSLIPPKFRDAIWRELNPSAGTVEARLNVLVHDQGTQLGVAVRPRGVTLTPAGFPIPIEEVGGAFQVSLALADGQELPEILNVAWEHVTGRVSGGDVVSRGAVWPSDPDEGTTLYVYIDASDLALSPPLVKAIPASIREVYETFDPQGVVRNAKVTLVGGPHDVDPQLFVEVGQLDGSISAMHVDYRMRLEGIQGSFSLKPGPSVRVIAAGQLEHGGRASVDAQVLAGDLIHVEVEGEDVPVGARVMAALPPAVADRVAPFRPQGGLADFRVVVRRGAAGEIIRPHVEVDVEGVSVRHDDFPYPLTATGSLELDPVFAPGAGADDDPTSVALRLDLDCVGPGLEAGSVRGPLAIRLEDGQLDGDIQVGVRGLDLGPPLLDVLPPVLAELRQTLRPSGRVSVATARVRSPERFQVSGRGDGLVSRLEQFPYPLMVDTFQVEREDDEVRIRRVRGSTPGGGMFGARGVVAFPREAGGVPLVDINAQARRVVADEALMRAVPDPEVRQFLLDLQPEGRLSADVSARITPGIGNQPEILLDLEGVDLRLDKIVPELERFQAEPLRDVRGRVRIEIPGRVELQGLRGDLAGARVELAGILRDPASLPPSSLTAAAGGPLGALAAWARPRLGAPLDLNLHVAGFDLNAETQDLMGPKARAILETFPARGRVDLAAVVHRSRLDVEPHLLLRFQPNGLWTLPSFLQVPLEEVQGVLEIRDGDPHRIDLSGRVGSGRFRLRRDEAREERFFQGASKGMALRVDLAGLGRPAEPDAREDFQRFLPRGVQAALDDADPQGPLDMQLAMFLPHDFAEGDGAIDWVAEIRPQGFAATAGLRLDDVTGVVRASGRFSEMRQGAARGELRIEQLDWKKQTLSDIRGPFELRGGVLRMGQRDRPIVGRLYGGQAALQTEFRFSDGAYRGWLEVREASVARCLEELGELREEPGASSSSSARAITGELFATMDFLGGGRQLDGRPREFMAEGALHARETNLVEVKAFDWLRTVRDALRGETTKPEAFETMHVDYGMSLDRVTLRAVRLDSPSLILVGGEDVIQGGEGWIRISEDPETNGDIFLDLTPFDTGSTVLDNLLQMSVPLTGVTVRNKVYDPQVIVGVPFYGAAEKIWRGILDDEESEAPPPPDEGDDDPEDD